MRSKMASRLFSLSCRRFSSKLGYCDHRGLYCRDDTAFVVGIVKSMGAAFSSAYSHFSSSGLGATSQAASGVVDGNYSFANMQMENVSGYSWGTNSTTSFGQMSRQLANGGMSTQTRDGSMVWDSGGAMSKLPVDINVGRQIASAQQQMAREADVGPKARCMAITAA